MKTEHTTFDSFTTSVIALKLMVFSFELCLLFAAGCCSTLWWSIEESDCYFPFSSARSPLPLSMISVWLLSLVHKIQLVSQLVYYQTFIIDAAATTEFESDRDTRTDRVARTLFKLIHFSLKLIAN